MSYARLVLDLDGTERREQRLDEVVLLVVEGGAAERGDAHASAQRVTALIEFLPRVPPDVDDAIGDHVHGLVEAEVLPFRRERTPVLDRVFAHRPGDQRLGG